MKYIHNVVKILFAFSASFLLVVALWFVITGQNLIPHSSFFIGDDGLRDMILVAITGILGAATGITLE